MPSLMHFPYRIDRTGRTAQPRDDAEYVRQLIEQVLSTVPGERVLRPQLGTGVRELTFAPANEQSLTATQHLVRASLQQWLAAWIEVAEVSVSSEEAQLTVVIRYRHRGEQDLRAVTVPMS